MYKNYFLLLLTMIYLSTYAIDNVATINDSVTFFISEELFDSSKVYIQYCKNDNKKTVYQINNGPIYGVDRSLPKTYVKSIVLKVGQKKYCLDSRYMYNAWGKRVNKKIKYLGTHFYDQNNGVVRGVFSDASGTFVVQWQITNGIAFREVLTSDNEVVNLFLEHIDPPVYD